MTHTIQVSEETIITPLETFLQEVTPKSPPQRQTQKNTYSIQKTVEQLFPEQQYDDKDIQIAKGILGEEAKKLTPEEISEIVAETQYLLSSWLDDFERNIFDGMTLNELLHEKGGLL